MIPGSEPTLRTLAHLAAFRERAMPLFKSQHQNDRGIRWRGIAATAMVELLVLFALAFASSSFHSPASMSPLQSRRGSSRTAPPDQSSQADHPSRKSPRAACPHQKTRIDPSYPHPRILLCQSDSHKFSKDAIFLIALPCFRHRLT